MKYIALLPMVALLVHQGRGQGTFQNLDFENATISQTQPAGLVSATDALPSWSVFLGASQQTQVGFNYPSTGSTWISLFGTNQSGFGHSIAGQFSVFLQGGGIYPSATISQVGLVPTDSQSLLFRAALRTGVLIVSLNGQGISFTPLSTTTDYTLYGADVSAFAGQTGDLRFSALGGGFPPSYWILDSITFSDQPIPEPCAVSFWAVALLLSAARMRHRIGRRKGSSAKFVPETLRIGLADV